MHMKFVPLGVIACLFVSAASARSLYSEQSTHLVARCHSTCDDGDDWNHGGDHDGEDNGDDWDHDGEDGDHDGGHDGDHDGGHDGDHDGGHDGDHDGGHDGGHDGHHGGGSGGGSLIDVSNNNIGLSNIATDILNDATVTNILNDLTANILSDGGNSHGGHGGNGHDGGDNGHDGGDNGHDGEHNDDGGDNGDCSECDGGDDGHDNEGGDNGDDGNDACGRYRKRGLIGVTGNDVDISHVAEDIANCLNVNDIANDANVDAL